jgi:mediator of RNA polymerase II transcription subunit 13
MKPTLSTIPTIPPVGLPPRAAVHSARSLQPLPSRVEVTVDGVSREVSGFVDYVAKERERERERIKRERDNHTNPVSLSHPLIVYTNGLEREQTSSSPSVVGVTIADNQEANRPPSAEARDLFDGLDTHPEDKTQDTPATREQSPEVTSPYEMYPGFNPSWAQTADQFPSLEIDYEMGFGMGINTIDRGAGAGDETGVTTDLDNIYGVFTDDDFDFFDRPNLDDSYLEQAPPASLFRDTVVPQPGIIPLVAAPTSPANGATTHHGYIVGDERPASPSPSPWTSTPRVDPLALVDPTQSMSPPSISSHSTPSTPQGVIVLERPSATHGSSIFDPVWFSPMHRTSDHKYASGKFSLSGQRAVRVVVTPQHNSSWRFQYNDATDPRISVVRRLTAFPHEENGNGAKGGSIPRDDWITTLSEGEGEDWSDVESLGDTSAEFVEVADISVLLDRPCTPPPQFTPLGPSLLDCQFHHSHLLPLSRPLYSPSSALTTTGLQGIVPTISVPTPVSPPEMLGEKLRSWEAAASLLVREVVENPLWAESWQVNNRHAFRITYASSTCQGDVSQLANALDTLDDSHTSLEMGTLFDLGKMLFCYTSSYSRSYFIAAGSLQPHQGDVSSSLQNMEPPLFSVGKGKSIVNVSPSAIRFWEKTALHPVGGQKNVNAFVFYEGEGVGIFENASRWFRRVSNAYTVRLYLSYTHRVVYTMAGQELWIPRTRPLYGRFIAWIRR